jgi:hypothetical protein
MRKLLILLCVAIFATGCVHAGVKAGGGSAGADGADGAVFIEGGLGWVGGVEVGNGSFSYQTENGEETDSRAYMIPYVGIAMPVPVTSDVGVFMYGHVGVPLVSNADVGISGEFGLGMYFDEFVTMSIGYKKNHINNMRYDNDRYDVNTDSILFNVGFVWHGRI